MDVSTTVKKFGLEQAFNYLYKDPSHSERRGPSRNENNGGKFLY